MNNKAKKAGIVLLILLLVLTAGCVTVQLFRQGVIPGIETLDTMGLNVNMQGEPVRIDSWYDGEMYHFFLPSGAEPEKLSFDTGYGVTLQRADGGEKQLYQADTPLTGLELETEYLVGCRHDSLIGLEPSAVFHRGENIFSVHITTENGDIASILDVRGDKVRGHLLAADPQCKILYEGPLTYIKGRGNASWFFDKKAFKIKLQQEADLLGLGTAREFCLLSQQMDGTMLRNKIAFDLAAQVGLAYTPDAQFADLYIDGEYWGLYLVTDQVDISEGSVDIPGMTEQMEYFNSGSLSGYPQRQTEDLTYFDIPRDPQDITGSYLLEMDKFYFERKPSRFKTPQISCVTLKNPQYASKNQVEYISRQVGELETALQTWNYSQVRPHIDEESWVRMGILQEVMVNYDFMGSSQYFYKLPDRDGEISPICAGPVWDMDYTLQRFAPNVLMMNYQSWYNYLYGMPEFNLQIKQTYNEVFRPLIQELMDTGVDGYAETIRPSAEMNDCRWAALHAEKYGGEGRFQRELNTMKAYLGRRITFLDDLWIQQVPMHGIWLTSDKDAPRWYVSFFYRPGQPFEPPEKFTNPVGYELTGWYYGTPENPGDPIRPGDPVYRQDYVFAKYEPIPGEGEAQP